MYKPVNFSAYLSNFDELRSAFPDAKEYQQMGGTPFVFISLHIVEEGTGSYISDMKKMTDEIRAMGYQMIADISERTLRYLNKKSFLDVAKEYGITMFRPDFGFSKEEIVELAKEMPICLNATNLKEDIIDAVMQTGSEVWAMHNYYPRPETGLDEDFFMERNALLKKKGIPVMAFIAGDIEKRAPIFEGLPTVERHRNLSPYLAYLELVLEYGVDYIFVGDGDISVSEKKKIEHFRRTSEIYIPIQTLSDKYDSLLFDRSYTIRDDSPRWLKRLMESRGFSSFGTKIAPELELPRRPGTITIDNEKFNRYSGEMHIVVENLPEDERVNVIARIPEKYLSILPFIKNERVIRFFPIDN